MEEPTSLRARKKLRTRRALERHALRLFASHGFEAVTVDQIAAAADVSRRTFFRYFATKEAVVFDTQDERLTAFRAALEGIVEGETPYQSVRRALRTVAGVFSDQKEDVLRLHHIVAASPTLTVREHQMDRQWEAALAERLVGDRDDDADWTVQCQVIAGALIGALRVILQVWTQHQGEVDLQVMGDGVLDRTLDALRAMR